MCGICGYVYIDRDDNANPSVVDAMCRRLAHRGPDDQGTWSRGPVALGHRRLSIIDVDGGHQPMPNEDGSVWVSYNGEVYNYRELREELIGKGHEFSTNTDTEVMVHLYEEEGPDFVSRLEGMFAVAIWDDRLQRLVLARDRMGQKPLYWGIFAQQLVFGSELKALLAHPSVSRELDLDSLSRFLALQAVPAPYSILKGIHKLIPSGRLVCERGTIKLDTYWDFPLGATTLDISLPEAEQHLLELLGQAVEKRLMSDVPLGVFVSGGIDSSVVAALMARSRGRDVKSFAIGFDVPSFDESAHARAVAKYLGTDHHEEILAPAAGLDVVPELCRLLDEPFADASVVPTYLLSRFARQHVTVALGGDGSDELLAGYPTFLAHRYAGYLEHVPAALRRGLLGPLARACPAAWERWPGVSRIKKLTAAMGHQPGIARHYSWRGSFLPDQQAELLTADAFDALTPGSTFDQARDYVGQCPSRDMIEQMLYLDTKLYMQDNILVKTDRASMAHGLEVRAPFMDRRVVEFVARLPLAYKLRGNVTKFILKQAARELLPAPIIHRPKQGFAMPVANWLRGAFRPLVEDVFSADRLQRAGLYRPSYVQTLVQDHISGRCDNHRFLWPLLMFELWQDEYLQSPAPAPVPMAIN